MLRAVGLAVWMLASWRLLVIFRIRKLVVVLHHLHNKANRLRHGA